MDKHSKMVGPWKILLFNEVLFCWRIQNNALSHCLFNDSFGTNFCICYFPVFHISYRYHYGHAYSVSVSAYEEIGKAWITWLAVEGFVPFDDEDLEKVYRYHEAKVAVAFSFSAIDWGYTLLGMGFIDIDDVLKENLTEPKRDITQ